MLSGPLYSPPPFLSSSSKHLFSPNSIYSRYSHHTSEALRLKNIYFPPLSTSCHHESAPYNAVGTIAPSNRHIFAFIPNPLLLSTLLKLKSLVLPSTPHSFCVPHPFHILHSLLPVYCRYLKQSTSSKAESFGLAYIRHPCTHREHLIILLTPTFTLNFLLSHTLPNSLTSLYNFSSESATCVLSYANNSRFLSNQPPFTLSSSNHFPRNPKYQNL